MKENLILVHRDPITLILALLEEGRLEEVYFETEETQPLVGNIIKGKVTRVLPGMQAAFVDIGLERAGFLYAGEFPLSGEESDAPHRGEVPDIRKLVREGDEITVQVIKAPIGTKGARLTADITLPGRYLVLSPRNRVFGVSRRIRLAQERHRLRKIIQKIAPEDMGLIARTVTEGTSEAELKGDLEYLLRVWKVIEEREKRNPPPAVLYEEPSLAIRIIRDHFTEKYSKIITDHPQEYKKIQGFLKSIAPHRTDDLVLYEGPRPMLEVYGVEKGIREALKPVVTLPSGGTIVIEETEALTSIDVNTRSFVGTKDLEETVLMTNLEAAREIARQIRLRNIGGMIIVDFIDMDLPRNRQKVFSTLKEALRQDRAKVTIQRISELGLVEITRQRLYESLTRTLGNPCPHCRGRGYLLSPRFLAGELYRKLTQEIQEKRPERVIIRAHPWLLDTLLEDLYPYLEQLEEKERVRITFLPDRRMAEEQYEIETGPLSSLQLDPEFDRNGVRER
jgi:ribonuclease G